MMPAMVPEELLAELDRRLAPVDAARQAAYPGESPSRQPVHTCYVPADAVVPGLATAWGTTALAALDEHGLPDLGLDPALLEGVLPRVRAKLATAPAGGRLEGLRPDPRRRRGRPRLEVGSQRGRGAEHVVVLLVRRAAVAVLGVDPEILDRLGGQLDPDARQRLLDQGWVQAQVGG